MNEFNLTLLPENITINVNEKTTILNAVMSIGIDISGSCGGKGKCGKCKIKIIDTHSEPTATELKHLSKDDLENGFRLACLVKIKNNIKRIYFKICQH